MIRLSSVALIVLAAVPGLAQVPVPPPGPAGPPALPGLPTPAEPPARSRVRATEHDVIVKGCLRGNRLVFSQQGSLPVSPVETALNASEFVLEGPRELMERLQQSHEGHFVEVSGTAIVPPSHFGTDRETSTKQVGPARVQIGARQESGPADDLAQPVRLKIESLTHHEDQCVNLR